jgi:hypothetical protein
MFVHVIKGRTSDPEGLLRQVHRWISDVRPDAIGYLGGTFGIGDDGYAAGDHDVDRRQR